MLPRRDVAVLNGAGSEFFSDEEWAGAVWSPERDAWEVCVVEGQTDRVAELGARAGIGPVVARTVTRSYADLNKLQAAARPLITQLGLQPRFRSAYILTADNCVVVELEGTQEGEPARWEITDGLWVETGHEPIVAA